MLVCRVSEPWRRPDGQQFLVENTFRDKQIAVCAPATGSSSAWWFMPGQPCKGWIQVPSKVPQQHPECGL